MFTPEKMENEIRWLGRATKVAFSDAKEIIAKIDCDTAGAKGKIQEAITELQRALITLTRRDTLKDVMKL